MKHSNSSDENRCISKDIQKVLKYFSSSSEEEHMENALALGADEGRGKLRKAAGICKRDSIRRYPNGTTRQVEDLSHREVS